MREGRVALPLLRAWRARVAAAAAERSASVACAPSSSLAPRLLAGPSPSPSPIAAAAQPSSPLRRFRAHKQQHASFFSSSSAAQGSALPSLSELLNNNNSNKGGSGSKNQQQKSSSGSNNNAGNNATARRPPSPQQQKKDRQKREVEERRARIAAETQAAAQDTAERLAARLEMFERGPGGRGGGGRGDGRRGGGGGGKAARAASPPAGRQPGKQQHLQPADRRQRNAAAAEERQKMRAAAAQQVAGRWASRLQELQQQQQGGKAEGAAAASSSSSSASSSATNELEDDDLPKSSRSSSTTTDPSTSLREVLLTQSDAEPGALTARRLAALLGCGPARVERLLADLGEPVKSEEDPVALDAAELAALELGAALILPTGAGGNDQPDASSSILASAASSQLLLLEPRPPVVTVMGHVDHGKTSLLDALRRTDVAGGEAGGITQHIGAFSVELPGSSRRITFLDTPGHAAFGAMRARGAAVTDVVVLVVAADDGVMPQTAEALAHARAAGCPVVVAITKCDAVPPERPAQVKAQLAAELDLELEDFGGTVQCVETALPRGVGEEKGLRELEEALLLQAEVMELKAARRRRVVGGGDGEGGGDGDGNNTVRVPASGTVVEAHVERGMGPVATVVVQRGELRVGDVVVCGSAFGRVRALRGGGGGNTNAAVGPGEHALVSGLRSLPSAGDELAVVSDEDRAARIARARLERAQDYARASLLRARHASAERRRAAECAEAARKKALSARLNELRNVKRHMTGELNKALAEFKALKMGKAGGGGGALGAEGEGGVGAAAAGEDATDAAATPDDADADANNKSNAPHPDAPVIPFIIKADVQGSAEAVRDALMALPTRGTAAASVVLCAVGPPSLSDAHLAAATGARLLAFNVRPSGADVDAAIKNGGVRVMEHNVIYRLLDDVRELLEREGAAAAAAAADGGGGGDGALFGSSSPGHAQQQGEREVVVGSGTVLQTFPLLRRGKNVGTVAGLGVGAGSLVRSDAAGSAAASAAAAAALSSAAGKDKSSSSSSALQVARLEYRLMRDGAVVVSGLPATDLRRQKLDVESVGRGTQCGLALDGGGWGGVAPKAGDVVECVAVVRGG